MKTIVVAILCMLGAVVHAEDKKPASTPAATTPPEKFSDLDFEKMKVLQAQEQMERLTAELVQTQAELAQCQMPRNAEDRAKRRKALHEKYKLHDGDLVKDDGTIVRKKEEKKKDEKKEEKK